MSKEKKILAVLGANGEGPLKEMKGNLLYDVRYTFLNLEGIVDPIAYVKGAWCLKTLGKKLPNPFGLTDLDGFLNYYGYLLFLEFKKSPNDLKKGQLTALANLVKQSDATIFMAFGEPCKPTSFFVMDSKNPYGSDLMKTDLEGLQDSLQKWCEEKIPEEEFRRTYNWDKWRWKLEVEYAEEGISRIQEQSRSLQD